MLLKLRVVTQKSHEILKPRPSHLKGYGIIQYNMYICLSYCMVLSWYYGIILYLRWRCGSKTAPSRCLDAYRLDAHVLVAGIECAGGDAITLVADHQG